MNEWISVEDRLPEPGVRVLAYHKLRNLMEVRYIEVVETTHLKDMSVTLEPSWYPGGSFGWHTHWMPLPSPPDTGEK